MRGVAPPRPIVPPTELIPTSRFLAALPVYASRRSAGLLHPAADHGVHRVCRPARRVPASVGVVLPMPGPPELALPRQRTPRHRAILPPCRSSDLAVGRDSGALFRLGARGLRSALPRRGTRDSHGLPTWMIRPTSASESRGWADAERRRGTRRAPGRGVRIRGAPRVRIEQGVAARTIDRPPDRLPRCGRNLSVTGRGGTLPPLPPFPDASWVRRRRRGGGASACASPRRGAGPRRSGVTRKMAGTDGPRSDLHGALSVRVWLVPSDLSTPTPHEAATR